MAGKRIHKGPAGPLGALTVFSLRGIAHLARLAAWRYKAHDVLDPAYRPVFRPGATFERTFAGRALHTLWGNLDGFVLGLLVVGPATNSTQAWADVHLASAASGHVLAGTLGVMADYSAYFATQYAVFHGYHHIKARKDPDALRDDTVSRKTRRHLRELYMLATAVDMGPRLAAFALVESYAAHSVLASFVYQPLSIGLTTAFFVISAQQAARIDHRESQARLERMHADIQPHTASLERVIGHSLPEPVLPRECSIATGRSLGLERSLIG